MATTPSLRLDKPTIKKNGGQGGRRGSVLISTTSSSNDGSSFDYTSISKVITSTFKRQFVKQTNT